MTPAMDERTTLLHKYFATLVDSREPALQQLLASAHIVRLQAAQPVFHAGAMCQNYLLVLKGSVCVYLTTITGRDVVLYHVGPGESCVITTSCLLGGNDYPAAGVTEEPTIALAISAQQFQQTLASSIDFRKLVFANLGERISQLIARIEAVTVGAIDQRLAEALLANARQTTTITTTHQQLAAELGTAREVVSRHLKQFSAHGWIRMRRGTVEIVDRAALAKLSCR